MANLTRKKRRSRSFLTEKDAIQELREFAKRIIRMKATSEGFDGRNGDVTPDNEIVLSFLIKGDFVDKPEVFEALRVIGEYKLPAKLSDSEERKAQKQMLIDARPK